MVDDFGIKYVGKEHADHLIAAIDFYLGTTMTRYEYLRLSITIIPQEIIDQYNLLPLVRSGYVYIEIQRGIYRLPQAGILANNQLTELL